MGSPVALTWAYEPGQTPLDADEAAQLIAKHITTQGALNEWEQLNIQRALPWAKRSRKTPVLSETFCTALHRQMFGQTWQWAGTYRQSDKNIGVAWHEIPIRLRQLLANVQYWLDNQVYPLDETATRFHHQLVWVHVFPNGNGRHARLMTDCLLTQCGAQPFSWGGGNLMAAGDVRGRYLACLRAADGGDLSGLLEFVRS